MLYGAVKLGRWAVETAHPAQGLAMRTGKWGPERETEEEYRSRGSLTVTESHRNFSSLHILSSKKCYLHLQARKSRVTEPSQLGSQDPSSSHWTTLQWVLQLNKAKTPAASHEDSEWISTTVKTPAPRCSNGPPHTERCSVKQLAGCKADKCRERRSHSQREPLMLAK